MKTLVVFVLVSLFLTAVVGGLGTWMMIGVADAESPPADPSTALAELEKGNRRFVRCCRTRSTDTRHDAACRRQTAQAQHPFASVLCCSDSRVSPEFIFDQRPGSIFEVRNAGNVVDDDVLASIEYAVEHLRTPLVVVLGHKGCGAIEAVCQAGDKPLHNHLRALQAHMAGIRPQILAFQCRHTAALVDRLARENASHQALSVLRESEPLSAAVRSGRAGLLYALYDMEIGSVEFFDLEDAADLPRQGR
ncbi:MAG: carbonic anhydrase [Gemmataceae bacterium]